MVCDVAIIIDEDREQNQMDRQLIWTEAAAARDHHLIRLILPLSVSPN